MATITLYSGKINQMSSLINKAKTSVKSYKSDLKSLKSKVLSIDESICDVDDVISSIKSSTKTQEDKIETLENLKQDINDFISDVVRIDGDAADAINKSKDDFYDKYEYLKPECEKSGWEKFKDGCKKVGEWCQEHWKEILAIAVVITGVVLCFVPGLNWLGSGILIGSLKGALSGGLIGGLSSWASGGSFWEGFKDGVVTGAIFGGASWVAPSTYFLGIGAVIVSGIILKKTKLFAGDPAPFVMELPAYHMPTVGTVLRSMWERGWSFIKKAGTIILLSTIFVWFTSYFGVVDGTFRMLSEDEIDASILAVIGKAIAWLFAPLGWGNWQATVASITGLVAKENIVGTLGILYSAGDGTVYQNMAANFTAVSGYAFLAFNLLCAPCFAAMGAIKREMNNRKWFFVAVGYQCGFAYLIGLIVNNIGLLAQGVFSIWTVVAILVIIGMIYLLVRPYKESQTLKVGKTSVAASK